MTDLDEKTCEQLSAWMDGALPADEARFLERRLEHDLALREKWERLQLASSRLRGHALRPMPDTLSVRIAEAIADQSPGRAGGSRARPGWIRWAVAASLAVAAILVAPRFFGEAPPAQVADMTPVDAAPTPAVPADATTIVNLPQATPGSADFVASTAPVEAPAADAIADADPAGGLLSPEEFPLDPTAPPKSWPRSSAPGGADAAMEGYLVRHSEMAGADALGGFVPYLDVVAADDAVEAPAAAETAPAAAPAPAQERK